MIKGLLFFLVLSNTAMASYDQYEVNDFINLITLGNSLILVWDKLMRNKSTFKSDKREITRSFNEVGPKVDNILILLFLNINYFPIK